MINSHGWATIALHTIDSCVRAQVLDCTRDAPRQAASTDRDHKGVQGLTREHLPRLLEDLQARRACSHTVQGAQKMRIALQVGIHSTADKYSQAALPWPAMT